MFAGYKTYLVAGLVAITSTAKYMGYIDYNAYESLMGLLMGSGLVTMRQAIKAETAALPKPVELRS